MGGVFFIPPSYDFANRVKKGSGIHVPGPNFLGQPFESKKYYVYDRLLIPF